MIRALPITGNPYLAMDNAEGKEADQERSEAVIPHRRRHARTSPSTRALNTPGNPSPRPTTSQMLRAAMLKSRIAAAQEKLPALLWARRCVKRTPCKVSSTTSGSSNQAKRRASPRSRLADSGLARKSDSPPPVMTAARPLTQSMVPKSFGTSPGPETAKLFK